MAPGWPERGSDRARGMSATVVRSAGLRGALVGLGSRQAAIYERAQREARRHPSRTWAAFPPMRSFGVSPSVISRGIHRLAELGVMAIQPVLGCQGEIRFTFGVRPWGGPLASTRRTLARMRLRAIAPGQIAFAMPPAERVPIPTTILTAPRAPETVWNACVLCGADRTRRIGVDPSEKGYPWAMRCLNERACAARRAAQ
jgi:hypothetical protein